MMNFSALRQALTRRKNYREPPVENVPNERVVSDVMRHANAWMGYGDRLASNIPSTVAGLILPGNSLPRAREASDAALEDFKRLYHRDMVGMAPRRLKDFKMVNDFAIGFNGKPTPIE